MSFCLRASWQNVLLLQLLLAGSVPQLDVQSVSSTDLAGQGAWNRDTAGKTSRGVSEALKQPPLRSCEAVIKQMRQPMTSHGCSRCTFITNTATHVGHM